LLHAEPVRISQPRGRESSLPHRSPFGCLRGARNCSGLASRGHRSRPNPDTRTVGPLLWQTEIAIAAFVKRMAIDKSDHMFYSGDKRHTGGAVRAWAVRQPPPEWPPSSPGSVSETAGRSQHPWPPIAGVPAETQQAGNSNVLPPACSHPQVRLPFPAFFRVTRPDHLWWPAAIADPRLALRASDRERRGNARAVRLGK
jgi:hypothetical protein